jgi:hypothetical protein
LLHFDLAGEVALAQVRELVREHGGVFADVVRGEIEPEVDADHAAGCSERIDLLRVDEYREQLLTLQFRVFRKAVELRLGVIFQERVADRRNRGMHLAQQLFADLLFHF